LWHGKPTELAGLFQGGSDRSFILLDMSVENPYPTVFHEYGHQLMNGNLAQEADTWFEEGFAEYFSSIEVDNKEAHVGKIPEHTYQTLQQGGWMKVGDLFRVRHNTATYNETGERRTVFYAESSMVAHYLYDNQLILKLGTYFQLKTKKNVPIEDAIQQAFGMDATHFDRAIRDYVSSGRFRYYSLPTPSDIVSSAYTIAPISAADTSALMADIHFHSPDYRDKAVEEFQAILKTDANNAAACRGLGYAYMRKKQFTEAAEYFQRAAQLN